MIYDVVKASSHEEAIKNAPWKVGDLALVSEVSAIANSDGTYTVRPEFTFDKDKLKGINRA